MEITQYTKILPSDTEFHMQGKAASLCSFHLAGCLQVMEVRHYNKAKVLLHSKIFQKIRQLEGTVLSGPGQTAASRLSPAGFFPGRVSDPSAASRGFHLLCDGFHGLLKEINDLFWPSLELCTSNSHSMFPVIF